MTFKRCFSIVIFIIFLVSASLAIVPQSTQKVQGTQYEVAPKIPALKINKQTYSHNEMNKDIDDLVNAHRGNDGRKYQTCPQAPNPIKARIP